ncbi:ParB/RepB/Spo0J family partition protein [Acidovorax sp. NCPPB 4044]|uniref:ParB/RepB/Spo0J family partition protein n=1 Tax=Acidovorax sp. NCPPB 4044 TaxID=2940490 RepID=UPI0023036C2D|nr:ParB/RepB/Spo0J family partition protein [Acidovorax sp. NCPPB 4044]MDA8522338.1 ParB/RepB/Spo0J family partition protein [Acidovorax sp. NCPPB 4044]
MATDQHDQVTAQIATLPPRMGMVRVDLIEESLTNPRKHFDSAKLQELADSIAATGVHQPILLRPLPGSRVAETSLEPLPPTAAWPLTRSKRELRPVYELVAGARRLRACRMAKVAEVPAMIRDMTDAEALEVQVIENLQREDVTPLEEAEGYDVLMRSGDLNADQVAAKIGKSRSYVYGRLKVLDLCTTGRQALREGKIDFSKALLAARIPHEKLQIEAVKWMTREGWDGEPRSYRECARHVQSEYMLELKGAQFPIKDATLVPAAGACTECRKRTGADRDLFSDVPSADVCTDTKCFHAKAQAHTDRLTAQAREKGQTVIAGKEAEELFGGNSWNAKIKGYRRLDVVDDSPTNEPLRKIIGKQMKAEGIVPTKVENPRKRGELIDALPNEVALRLLKAVEGQAQAAQQVTKEAKAFADEKKAKAEAKAKAQYEQGWRTELMHSAWVRLSTSMDRPGDYIHAFDLDVHRYVALRQVKSLSSDDALAVAGALGLERVGAHAALIDYAKTCVSPEWLQLLCIMQADSSANDHSYGGRIANEGLMLVAGKVFGDELADVIKRVKREMAEKFIPKPAAPPAASTPPPAAQASPTRAKDKGKNRPAVPAAGEVPKTSKAHAAAQIAEALAELEGSEQAPAAQGDDEPAVPDGQPAATIVPGRREPYVAPAARGNKAQPVADAQAAAAPAGQAVAGSENGAAAVTMHVEVGQIVRVKDGLKSPGGKLRKICGRVCLVQHGGESLVLRWGPRRDEMAVDVAADDVEPYQAMPNIGSKVRMLINRDMAREALVWRQGTIRAIKSDGWEVMFSARGNGVADVELVQPDELEVLDV